MKNEKLSDFQNKVKSYGYERVRQEGSHVVYKREVVMSHTISVPESKKEINGPMANRLIKQMQDFEDYICMNTKGVK